MCLYHQAFQADTNENSQSAEALFIVVAINHVLFHLWQYKLVAFPAHGATHVIQEMKHLAS